MYECRCDERLKAKAEGSTLAPRRKKPIELFRALSDLSVVKLKRIHLQRRLQPFKQERFVYMLLTKTETGTTKSTLLHFQRRPCQILNQLLFIMIQ
jgi:hypothetical protein